MAAAVVVVVAAAGAGAGAGTVRIVKRAHPDLSQEAAVLLLNSLVKAVLVYY